MAVIGGRANWPDHNVGEIEPGAGGFTVRCRDGHFAGQQKWCLPLGWWPRPGADAECLGFETRGAALPDLRENKDIPRGRLSAPIREGARREASVPGSHRSFSRPKRSRGG
jgi:hypothetical protein